MLWPMFRATPIEPGAFEAAWLPFFTGILAGVAFGWLMQIAGAL
jgi:hypothetical protein